MRTPSCLIALLVLCAGCCQHQRVGEWTETRKCVRVLDGDTIEIENGDVNADESEFTPLSELQELLRLAEKTA